MAEGRVGVCVVEDFYKKYTGFGDGNLTLEQWINLEDYKIAPSCLASLTSLA